MAVQFLNNIDLNNNQLQEFKVDNQNGSDPTGLSGEGQLIYRIDQNVLKFHTGSDNWVTLGTSSSTGTVTSVSTTHEGNAFTASIGNDANVNPSVDITMPGNSNEYINGDGDRVLLSTLPQGDVTGITPTDGLTGTLLTGPVPVIKVEYAGSDNIVLKASDLNGAGTPVLADSIMFSDATDSDVRTATLTQILALAPQGDITGLAEGTYINIDNATGPVPTINHDLTSRTDTSNGTSPAFGGTFTAVDSVTTNSTGHLTALNLKTVTLPSNPNTNTTYTLPVSAGGGNSSVITLDASSGTDTTVTFNGTPDEIALTEGTGLNGSITIGLPDDVTIAGIATLSGGFSASADSSMNSNKITNLATGSADNDAVNVAQLAAAVAGSARFRGGYNANTGLTTDLGVDNGSLDGASNIASELGDFFIVTTDGNAFYSTALEVGDTIYANQIIAANSTPAESSYTVVIQDANIAGAGSTDGATEKGVAGFNSNVFTVTSNGFVEAKVFNGSQRGVVPNTSSNVATVFLNGQGAFTTPPNDFLTGLSFATGTGILTATIPNQSNVTVDLDGRYITGNETITLTGDVTGSGTTSIVTTIAADAVEASMLNNNVISGQTELTATPAATDEFLISDGGVIKRIDYSVLIGGADSGVTSIIASTAPSRIGLTPTTSSSGAVTIGLNLAGLTAVTTPLTTDTLPIVNSSTNKKITVANLTTAVQTATSKAYTIASGETTDDLTYPFTLTAGTINDVMIQVVQSSGTESGETVFCDVDRISTTQCRITFGAALTESVRVLVQKIG